MCKGPGVAKTLEARENKGGHVSRGFHVQWEECKPFNWKVRDRRDQTGRLVYEDGDDSYFPIEETEDSEWLSHLPNIKLAGDGAQVDLSVKPCWEERGKTFRCSEAPPHPLEG